MFFSFLFFSCHCSLDEKKGVTVGQTYRNDMECRQFVNYIARVERQKTQELLDGSKFLSILADGSTDSAVIEEELLYVQLCRLGNVSVRFIGIDAVERADATHITAAIRGLMNAVSPGWESKLVACATDGAAVMTRAMNGVVSRLRGDRGYVVGMHCMAHRLELAFNDSIKTNTTFQRVEELLSGLYSFYHQSPLNRATLLSTCEALNKTPLMPTRIGGTRWVGHLLRALDNFLRGYAPILQHLEKVIFINVLLCLVGYYNVSYNNIIKTFLLLLRCAMPFVRPGAWWIKYFSILLYSILFYSMSHCPSIV